MPPKKNKPKITPGQLRGIIREMNQPPFNARRRSPVPQTKLVARKRGENPPRTSKVTVSRGLTRKQRALASATRERPGGEWKMAPTKRGKTGYRAPFSEKTNAPAAAKPKVQKPLKGGIRARARGGAGKGGKLFYTPGKSGKRLVGMDIRQLPRLVQQGIISQSEANIIRNAAEGRRGVNYNLSASAKNTSSILKRELNLTPMARARLDAEEARLAREAERSASLQLKESRRNKRVQNPLTETAADREAKRRIEEGLRAIEKAEKKKKKLQGKQPSRTPRTHVGRGVIPPIMPGGGGGMFQQLQ